MKNYRLSHSKPAYKTTAALRRALVENYET